MYQTDEPCTANEARPVHAHVHVNPASTPLLRSKVHREYSNLMSARSIYQARRRSRCKETEALVELRKNILVRSRRYVERILAQLEAEHTSPVPAFVAQRPCGTIETRPPAQ